MSEQLDPNRTFDVDGLTKVVDAVAEGCAIIALALDGIKVTEPEAYAALSNATLRLTYLGEHAETCILAEGGALPAKQAAKDRFIAAGFAIEDEEDNV